MNEHIENIGPIVQRNKKKKTTQKGWGDAIHTASCLQLNIYQASIQTPRACRG